MKLYKLSQEVCQHGVKIHGTKKWTRWQFFARKFSFFFTELWTFNIFIGFLVHLKVLTCHWQNAIVFINFF